MKIRPVAALLPWMVLATCLPLFAGEPVPEISADGCSAALATPSPANAPAGADVVRLPFGPPDASAASDACCIECANVWICTNLAFCCPTTGQCCVIDPGGAP